MNKDSNPDKLTEVDFGSTVSAAFNDLLYGSMKPEYPKFTPATSSRAQRRKRRDNS